MVKVTIPITAVEKGKEYEVPVNVTGLPKGLTNFEMVITTDPSLAEIDDYSTAGTMAAGVATAFHNSPTVYNQPKEGQSLQDAGISLTWKSPYNRGCALVSMAATKPVTGKIMVKLKVWAAETGNAVFNAVYLNYGTTDWKKGTITAFGKRPLLLKLIDGVWTPYEG